MRDKQNKYTIRELLCGDLKNIPESSGIYQVLSPASFDFTTKLEVYYPIHFPKYEGRTIDLDTLEKRLSIYKSGKSNIIYIGKAENLRKRIGQLIFFEYPNYNNQSSSLPHYGGRAIWQLVHNQDLLLTYEIHQDNPEKIETELIDRYILKYDPTNRKMLPFANEKRGPKQYRLF